MNVNTEKSEQQFIMVLLKRFCLNGSKLDFVHFSSPQLTEGVQKTVNNDDCDDRDL